MRLIMTTNTNEISKTDLNKISKIMKSTRKTNTTNGREWFFNHSDILRIGSTEENLNLLTKLDKDKKLKTEVVTFLENFMVGMNKVGKILHGGENDGENFREYYENIKSSLRK